MDKGEAFMFFGGTSKKRNDGLAAEDTSKKSTVMTDVLMAKLAIVSKTVNDLAQLSTDTIVAEDYQASVSLFAAAIDQHCAEPNLHLGLLQGYVNSFTGKDGPKNTDESAGSIIAMNAAITKLSSQYDAMMTQIGSFTNMLNQGYLTDCRKVMDQVRAFLHLATIELLASPEELSESSHEQLIQIKTQTEEFSSFEISEAPDAATGPKP